MVIDMKNTKYDRIADKYKSNRHVTKNAIIAFITGGIMGIIGEGLIEIYIYLFNLSRQAASTYMIITVIFFASLFTALGFFDKMVGFCKSGLLIPITGFAHSMTSSFLDYRKEGFVYGIGSNAFKLAGTVIVYGVLSAWFFGMVRFLLGG